MVRWLYRTPIPDRTLQSTEGSSRSRLAKLGLLEGGSTVKPVAGEPGEVTMEVVYRGLYAARKGLELEELLESPALQQLPFAPPSSQTELDGYYAVESSTGGRVEPQTDRLYRVTGTLVREGTRASHRRAVQTRVRQPDPGNSFGNEVTALIGVPSDATRVLWIDNIPAANTASVTVVRTENVYNTDVDLVDARDPSFDDPILVYDLPYADQRYGDARVWDTYGNASETDGDGNVQWARVFDPAHDPRTDNDLVVENGLIRLTFDDANNSLTAESWNDGTSSWDSVSLGASNWQLLETDIRKINGMTVRAHITFNDSTSPSTEYTLEMNMPRGYDFPQWLVPDGVTASVPSGLSTLLDPIADEQAYDATPEFGLVAREDI